MRASAAALLVCLLAGGPALARDHAAEARHHLKKANELADNGKCAAAVREFTAAYQTLHDPLVLFNRAECYRRLGENAKAVEDYRGYLKGYPSAPNRGEIEGRIAALDHPAPPRPAARPSPPAVATRPATAPARPPAPVAPAPAPSPAVAPVQASTPPASMPFLPPPPSGDGENVVLVDSSRPTQKDTAKDDAHGSHWLLWTTLAVVAVGGGTAGYLLLKPKAQELPMTMYGNYRF